MNKSKLVLFLVLILGLNSLGNDRINALKDSLSHFEGLKKAQSLLIIGNHYYPNNNDSALLYIEKALNEYQDINNEKGIISCYGLISDIYSSYGMYDTAIILNYKVIDWGEKNNDIRADIAYLGLANTYESINQPDKARSFFHKAIKGSYLPARRAAFTNLGYLYLNEKEFDSAQTYFSQGLKEYLNTDTSLHINKYNIATIYSNLASVEYGKGNYAEGIKLLNTSLLIFQEIDNSSSSAITYLKLGDGYGYIHKNDLSLQYYLKAKQIADSNQILSVKEDIYLSLSKYYQSVNDYKKSFTALVEYEKIHDNLMMQSYKSSIIEMEVKYNVQEKVNKIDSLKQEKKIIFSYAIALILSLLLASSIIILYINNRRQKYKNAKIISDSKSQLAAVKTKQVEQKLKRIKMNLHEKSAFIEELQEEIKKLGSKEDQKQMAEKVQLLRKTRILTDEDWKEYRNIFNEIHPSFINSIENNNNLSVGDQRQLIFLKLGLKQKEIAYLMGISTEGVKRARQRLSKKIGLKNTGELLKYIENL